MYSSANAQSDSTSSILAKLYFPFDFGITMPMPIDKNIKSGGLIKTGLEFRVGKEHGLFFRFNFDSRHNKFTIQQNQTTNVVDGKVTFNDYCIGLGYRIGGKKVKGFSLCQSGISTYNFPVISGTSNNFIIKEYQSKTSVFKITLGCEYYVAQNAALTIETVYILQTGNSAFWNNQFHAFGVSIGLTTTLF